MANVMPGSWRLTNSVSPSAENVAPVNSPSSRALRAKIVGSPVGADGGQVLDALAVGAQDQAAPRRRR